MKKKAGRRKGWGREETSDGRLTLELTTLF